jgi:hypothetical protein
LIRVGAARVLKVTVFARSEAHIHPDRHDGRNDSIFLRLYVDIETVDYNLGGEGPRKRFDRMVYPDEGLRIVDVEIFQQEIREYLKTVIQEIDQKSATSTTR